ncbi:TOBE domain-containing protein [Candidatus Bathyarchaeota archaeon]|nr:TOBE domain-containing protein [Candidatus Bathyarchaeota archaeon]
MDIGSLVRLRIKTKDGKSPTVQITKRLFNEMGFNVGSRVFMVFKVSCVELI